MPGDNSSTIAPGSDIEFPNDGPTFGTDITRLGPSIFNIKSIGIYQILFQISISEAGQLCIVLNTIQQDYTVVGRATGTSQIVGICLINITSANSVISIRNPLGEPSALTITPVAGGSNPVSAHLLIVRLT